MIQITVMIFGLLMPGFDGVNNMGMNFYRLSLNCYEAFLAASGIMPTKLAAAYIEYSGNSDRELLKEAEANGLAQNRELTSEGNIIAEIITMPEKTIIASNSSFGRIPLCFFCFKQNFWSFISIDYKNKFVTLLAPIEKSSITAIAKDALIGKLQILNYSPFSISLTNDELMIYNFVLMLMGNRAKSKSGPLLPLDCRFNYEEILLNREFAKEALAGEILGGNSDVFTFIKDPERCKNAFNKLLEKQILAKSPIKGYLQPGITMFYRLAPQKGMFVLSYSDLETKKGKKYYVFPNSILEVTADRNSLTFTAAQDIDYSLWSI